MECGEGRAVLDGQLIEREVIGGIAEGACQFALPGGERLALPRIDQIEGDAPKRLARERQCRQRFSDGMLAPQRLEAGIVERLAIDARRCVAFEVLRLHAGWIGLQRDFHIA